MKSAERSVVAMDGISREEALALLARERREELRERAHKTTVRCVERRFDFCAIINAKSGRCTEDCKWCAQSARWHTGCEEYGWVGTDACVKAALEAQRNGADRIGIVTSGRRLSPEDVDRACEAIAAIKAAWIASPTGLANDKKSGGLFVVKRSCPKQGARGVRHAARRGRLCDGERVGGTACRDGRGNPQTVDRSPFHR